MNIPLNGRIAIVDDQFDQALPLLNVLAQKKCPSLYFSGELKYLPVEGECLNDIRVLFLDINLIDNKARDEKELRSKLVPVIGRIISKDNYPYILVYWSRNEQEHAALVRDIFDKDLADRKPIGFLSQSKLAFFGLDGNRTDDFDEQIQMLFKNIEVLLKSYPAYKYLTAWENLVHLSTDKTLQEIFSSVHNYENWSLNANFLINKLGESFAGRTTFKNQKPDEKIKSAFQAFNNVFSDTLEYVINSTSFAEAEYLTFDPTQAIKENIYSVNKKLLISDEYSNMEYSGTVIQDSSPRSDKFFEELLNGSLNRKRIEQDLLRNTPQIDEKALQKSINAKCKTIRAEIRESWKKLYCVVTPLCDFVQGKYYNIRIVKGILVKYDKVEFIDDKSEAIFISPKFKFQGEVYAIILHFRYFFTATKSVKIKDVNPLFRLRQQLLAEIQSKLARHVSRQGVLFIDN